MILDPRTLPSPQFTHHNRPNPRTPSAPPKSTPGHLPNADLDQRTAKVRPRHLQQHATTVLTIDTPHLQTPRSAIHSTIFHTSHPQQRVHACAHTRPPRCADPRARPKLSCASRAAAAVRGGSSAATALPATSTSVTQHRRDRAAAAVTSVPPEPPPPPVGFPPRPLPVPNCRRPLAPPSKGIVQDSRTTRLPTCAHVLRATGSAVHVLCATGSVVHAALPSKPRPPASSKGPGGCREPAPAGAATAASAEAFGRNAAGGETAARCAAAAATHARASSGLVAACTDSAAIDKGARALAAAERDVRGAALKLRRNAAAAAAAALTRESGGCADGPDVAAAVAGNGGYSSEEELCANDADIRRATPEDDSPNVGMRRDVDGGGGCGIGSGRLSQPLLRDESDAARGMVLPPPRPPPLPLYAKLCCRCCPCCCCC
eukprot:311571-Chlamydomonas_euryale.AAC.2